MGGSLYFVQILVGFIPTLPSGEAKAGMQSIYKPRIAVAPGGYSMIRPWSDYWSVYRLTRVRKKKWEKTKYDKK